MNGIEPSSPEWKSGIIAVILHLQSELTRFFGQTREQLLDLLEPIDKTEPNIDSFKIRASDKSHELLQELGESLALSLGTEKAIGIVNAVDFNRYFGGFGLLDGQLDFVLESYDHPNGITSQRRLLRYRLFDPVTGVERVSGAEPFSRVSKHFGDDTFLLSDE